MNQDIQLARIGSLHLERGGSLPDVQLAYIAHGRLNADGRNTILVTHGYTSGPSMLSAGHHTAEGSWAPLLGPGRPLDTERFFIVCSNMLGSSFGSTGPNTLNPSTGKPWGPDFPRITVGDIVAAQKLLLQGLGVKHLHAVVGPSYGGIQALQWVLDHPSWVSAAGAVVSGLYSPPGLDAKTARAKYEDHPAWNHGWHYEGSPAGTLQGIRQRLFEQRQQTLHSYGLTKLYEDRFADPIERQQKFDAACRGWAERFDPNSMAVLADAGGAFDVRPRVHEINARFLLVQCTTDLIFPPKPQTRVQLAQMQGLVRYTELESPYGHMAPGIEWRKLEDELRWLLQ